MREILFRGKDIAGNWYYGVPLIFIEDYVCMTAPHTFNKAVIPETVGQYTGLTDKNGKKIFEGDIVKYSDPFPFAKEYIMSEVAFDFGFCGFLPFADYDCDCGEYVNADDCEVIGNVHDNPELLKGVTDDAWQID